MYDALTLAQYVIAKCTVDGHPISNLQLQKILYYIQKEFIKTEGEPAFFDTIEAWQFGPVIPVVYNKYCGYGSMSIIGEFDELDFFNSDDHKNIVDSIVDEKRLLKPWNLVNETHRAGGAWDLIYKNGVGNHKEIPLRVIINEVVNDVE